MKLLVVVETLNGSRIAWSIASTFTAPEPMPSRPERIPAAYIQPKPRRHSLHVITLPARPCGIGGVKAERDGPATGLAPTSPIGRSMSRQVRGVQQYEPEYDSESISGNPRRKRRAGQSAQRRRDLKKHSDADIGIALLQVCGGGSRGCRNDRHQRGSDRVADVYAKPQDEQRDDPTPPPSPVNAPRKPARTDPRPTATVNSNTFMDATGRSPKERPAGAA